jgi:hypothetical protein
VHDAAVPEPDLGNAPNLPGHVQLQLWVRRVQS